MPPTFTVPGDPPLQTPVSDMVQGARSFPFGTAWGTWIGTLWAALRQVFNTYIPRVIDTTYANPMTIDVTKGRIQRILTIAAVGNATINANAVGAPGQEIFVQIRNDGTGARTITFGTNFKPSGTVVGTVNLTAVVHFESDGTAWWEVARTLGL